jgi:hypothetical protein
MKRLREAGSKLIAESRQWLRTGYASTEPRPPDPSQMGIDASSELEGAHERKNQAIRTLEILTTLSSSGPRLTPEEYRQELRRRTGVLRSAEEALTEIQQRGRSSLAAVRGAGQRAANTEAWADSRAALIAGMNPHDPNQVDVPYLDEEDAWRMLGQGTPLADRPQSRNVFDALIAELGLTR